MTKLEENAGPTRSLHLIILKLLLLFRQSRAFFFFFSPKSFDMHRLTGWYAVNVQSTRIHTDKQLRKKKRLRPRTLSAHDFAWPCTFFLLYLCLPFGNVEEWKCATTITQQTGDVIIKKKPQLFVSYIGLSSMVICHSFFNCVFFNGEGVSLLLPSKPVFLFFFCEMTQWREEKRGGATWRKVPLVRRVARPRF